jgi:ATP-dependent DNA helicase RecG
VITDYLSEFGDGLKSDFEKVLLDKLPDVLDEAQKKHKIKNILQKLKNKGIIYPEGKVWKMSKPA